jgi:hypothetical protein
LHFGKSKARGTHSLLIPGNSGGDDALVSMIALWQPMAFHG